VFQAPDKSTPGAKAALTPACEAMVACIKVFALLRIKYRRPSPSGFRAGSRLRRGGSACGGSRSVREAPAC